MIMRKRLLPILVAVLMVFAMMPMTAGTVFAEGEEITWTPLPGTETIEYYLDEAGTVTLQGTGDIPGYGTGSTNKSPFYQNGEIKNVIIGEGITGIGDNTFRGCSSLETVSIPSGVKSINYYAFAYCRNLASADLPDGLEYIGNSAFYETGMKSIVIPDTVTELGEGAFSYCFNAKTLKISSNLKVIPAGAFSFCEKLKTVEIPDGVTKLGYAFGGCTDLKKITIPASVNSMEWTFQECYGLDEVTFKGDFPGTFTGVFFACDLTARYPYGNRTWTDEAIDSNYGGKVKWEGYCLTHVNAAAVKENVKAATALKTGSYEEVVYCKQCGKEISRKTVTIAKLKPTIKLSATKKTLKKGTTYTLKVSKLAKGDAVKSFKTSKKSVATVTSKGKIKAMKKGKAVITVTLKSGKKATCRITVK